MSADTPLKVLCCPLGPWGLQCFRKLKGPRHVYSRVTSSGRRGLWVHQPLTPEKFMDKTVEENLMRTFLTLRVHSLQRMSANYQAQI